MIITPHIPSPSLPVIIKSEDIEKICEHQNVFTYGDHLVNSRLGLIVGNHITRSENSINIHSFGITGFTPSVSSGDLFLGDEYRPSRVSKKDSISNPVRT